MKVVRPRSTQVRLEVDEEVATLFDDGQHYDAIIHAAIVGGRRDADDDYRVLYTNLNMFETLYKYVDQTDMFLILIVVHHMVVNQLRNQHQKILVK